MNANDNLETARLRLIPSCSHLLEIELTSLEKLASELNAEIPPGWPPEFMVRANPIFLHTLKKDPSQYKWLTWYWVLKNEPKAKDILIGCGGFLGTPDKSGMVEIGYSILPQFERKGYAIECCKSLIGWVFAHPSVNKIAAETFPWLGRSIKLLDKMGFRHTGAGVKQDTIRYELEKNNAKNL